MLAMRKVSCRYFPHRLQFVTVSRLADITPYFKSVVGKPTLSRKWCGVTPPLDQVVVVHNFAAAPDACLTLGRDMFRTPVDNISLSTPDDM